jgi:hypothetical protein
LKGSLGNLWLLGIQGKRGFQIPFDIWQRTLKAPLVLCLCICHLPDFLQVGSVSATTFVVVLSVIESYFFAPAVFFGL